MSLFLMTLSGVQWFPTLSATDLLMYLNQLLERPQMAPVSLLCVAPCFRVTCPFPIPWFE